MGSLKKVAGVKDKTSAEFGFDKWGLDEPGKLHRSLYRVAAQAEKLIMESADKTIREAIMLASKEYECYASLPILWIDSDGYGGPPPVDPTTVYVELPLGADSDEGPRWSFTFSFLIADLIESHEMGHAGAPIDEEARPTFEAVSASLKSLAQQIDDALARKAG